MVHSNKLMGNSLDIEIPIGLMNDTFDTFGTMVQPSDLNHYTVFLGIHFFLVKILFGILFGIRIKIGLGGSD